MTTTSRDSRPVIVPEGWLYDGRQVGVTDTGVTVRAGERTFEIPWGHPALALRARVDAYADEVRLVGGAR